jgi:hypothetical protein
MSIYMQHNTFFLRNKTTIIQHHPLQILEQLNGLTLNKSTAVFELVSEKKFNLCTIDLAFFTFQKCQFHLIIYFQGW